MDSFAEELRGFPVLIRTIWKIAADNEGKLSLVKLKLSNLVWVILIARVDQQRCILRYLLGTAAKQTGTLILSHEARSNALFVRDLSQTTTSASLLSNLIAFLLFFLLRGFLNDVYIFTIRTEVIIVGGCHTTTSKLFVTHSSFIYIFYLI